MRRLLLALDCATFLTGRSTGSDVVDVDNGGEFRFVEGTPTLVLEPAGRVAAVYTGSMQQKDLRRVLDSVLREA